MDDVREVGARWMDVSEAAAAVVAAEAHFLAGPAEAVAPSQLLLVAAARPADLARSRVRITHCWKRLPGVGCL